MSPCRGGSICLLSGQRRVSPDQRLRNTVLSVEMLFYRTYCHVSLPAFSPISVITSWPAWAAMAGGHNRRGSTGGVGHARRSWNAVRDDHSRPSLTGNAARALPFPTSQRPTCPFSFAPGGTPPARCEPFSAFPLIPGLSTCPAWPSAASTSARCEPFPAFPLLPGPHKRRGGAAARCRRHRSSGDARRRHRRSPRTRTPPNGLTSESASADRRGRGTLPRQSRKAT